MKRTIVTLLAVVALAGCAPTSDMRAETCERVAAHLDLATRQLTDAATAGADRDALAEATDRLTRAAEDAARRCN